MLSYSVGDVFNRYDIGADIAWALVDKDEIKEQMMNSPSYISFIDRFPDYRNKIVGFNHQLDVIVEAINPKTMNSLKLELTFNINNQKIREHITCKSLNNNRLGIDDYSTMFIDTFIENTKCLENDFEFPSKFSAWKSKDLTYEE